MACNRGNNNLRRTDADNFADLLGTSNGRTNSNRANQVNEVSNLGCENNGGLTAEQRRRIYEYLGCLCFNLFQFIPISPDHPSINCSLCVLAYGGSAPANHPDFKELCCIALANRRSGCAHGGGECLTPIQRQRVYQYLGRQCYRVLRCLDLPDGHPSLNESLLALANGRCLPSTHPTFCELLAKACDCPCLD
ncbi:MAG TPA: hypothetical protein DCY20_10515 [Firmicutes bacterium]|nr:hypothetical protein [Bacillota bacterium]